MHLLVLLIFVTSSRAGLDGDPFYERMDATNEMSFLAVRPFYTHVDDPSTERWRKDYLWPLYTQKVLRKSNIAAFCFSVIRRISQRTTIVIAPGFFRSTIRG